MANFFGGRNRASAPRENHPWRASSGRRAAPRFAQLDGYVPDERNEQGRYEERERDLVEIFRDNGSYGSY